MTAANRTADGVAGHQQVAGNAVGTDWAGQYSDLTVTPLNACLACRLT